MQGPKTDRKVVKAYSMLHSLCAFSLIWRNSLVELVNVNYYRSPVAVCKNHVSEYCLYSYIIDSQVVTGMFYMAKYTDFSRPHFLWLKQSPLQHVMFKSRFKLIIFLYPLSQQIFEQLLSLIFSVPQVMALVVLILGWFCLQRFFCNGQEYRLSDTHNVVIQKIALKLSAALEPSMNWD